MYSFNSNLEKEDRRRKESSDHLAVEISEDNEEHVAENRILKEQNQVDEHVRNDLRSQMIDRGLAKDKILETEKLNKQQEYRQFLLKQIEDKEKAKKSRNSSEIRGNSYVYSEDMVAPEMKKNMKLTKQQEMKDGLDECVRMKNALKQENKQMEIKEERERMDFLKKRDTDEVIVREQAKQQIEDRELRKDEAVRQWRTSHEDDEREQFMDSLTLWRRESKDLVDVEGIWEENGLLNQQVETAKFEEDSPLNVETNEIYRQDHSEVITGEDLKEENETIR